MSLISVLCLSSFFWDKFEKKQMACDINLSVSLTEQWFFLNVLTNIDHFRKLFDHHITIGDFPLSYRNQFIDLLCKSMDWLLYDRDLCHERVTSKGSLINLILTNRKYYFKNNHKFEKFKIIINHKFHYIHLVNSSDLFQNY